ncbi:alpha/beta fold hydrolase [Salinimonas lutimaris]|uniref:alpha/beta fold hydrolase n=1 Tax=Salinimonas lutimaris TaxID=914153 RepID=UPI0010C0FC36|nr:alpha/beta hydrolase [Salinimonas lutimaris]
MKEITVKAGMITLAGLDNEGTGPVVIGLHGYLDNAQSLAGLAPYLSGYRFIALDMAGHGKSGHRAEGAQYNLPDYLQDLHALISEQQFEPVILLGHSLGGILATLYAAVFPEQVKAVVSIDACGPLVESEASTAEQMRASIISRAGKTASRQIPVQLEKAIKARCEVSDIAPQHAQVILQRNIKQDGNGESIWASDSRLRTRSPLRLTPAQARALMEQIQCPVYIAGASDSFKQVKKMFAERSAWFKNAQCEYFVGGHHIHMEKPDEIGHAIQRFVEQL